MTAKPLSKKELSMKRRERIISLIVALFISSAILVIYKNIIFSLVGLVASFLLINIYFYTKLLLANSARIKKIEEIFPDFLELMSSNLRAGMTIDRSILLSSRPEFFPLDREILQAGKDIVTSRNIEKALMDMAKRIGSDKINKTILLIISGIRAGGDLAVLLEETSANMREKGFVEKKIYSNVMMYFIFIFLVVAIFAPALFSLSNVLVEVLTKIISGMPSMDSTISTPFSLSNVTVSVNFIKYFSLLFIVAIDFLASLILGLISKGEEKEGLKYFPIILILSISIFFLGKIVISGFLAGLL